MDPATTFGIAEFLAQTDVVGKIVIAILLTMSVASWYLIITKTIRLVVAKRRSERFLDMFWNAPSVQAVEQSITSAAAGEPFARLTGQALLAVRHFNRHAASRLSEAGSVGEFVTRTIRKALDEETARLESGLIVLASVGSTAPFVGLFGTVWGVYHALINIGMMGQGSLDKVAGPVGEALIMTALGLAVATPAVLAYNGFTRSNRLLEGNLDSFAHNLYTFLTTGAQFDGAVSETQPSGGLLEGN